MQFECYLIIKHITNSIYFTDLMIFKGCIETAVATSSHILLDILTGGNRRSEVA